MDEDVYIFNRNNFRGSRNNTPVSNFVCVKNDSIIIEDIRIIEPLIGRTFYYGEGNSLLYPAFQGVSIPHNDTLYTFNKVKMKLERSCFFDFHVRRPDVEMSERDIRKYIRACDKGEIPSSLYCLYEMDKYIFGIFNYKKEPKHVLIFKNGDNSLVSSPQINKDKFPILPIPFTDKQAEEYYIVSMVTAQYIKRQSNNSTQTLLHRISEEVENEDNNPVLLFWKMKN